MYIGYNMFEVPESSKEIRSNRKRKHTKMMETNAKRKGYTSF